ncbi:hypothetical protein DPMN_050520 [Dreissena polymorpha]|uniref:Uncharacterized protein n=1 Tax=Dreissena polymorpha TaxID=45954 RepID=A0A9D4CGW7_DREPO|nr:hypothetical protein DPMN_050520 [Dreissena polymorpha]
MADADISFDGQFLSLERGGLQLAKNVHDAVPLVLPTVPEVLRDPGIFIDGSIEVGRMQRVSVKAGYLPCGGYRWRC